VILHEWNNNNSEWGFSVFFEKGTESCFFLKNPKKQKSQVGCFFKKPGFFSTLLGEYCHSLPPYITTA